MKYNFYINILILKSIIYRVISVTIFGLIFGFRFALLASSIAFILYYSYDYLFSKIFNIRAENKGFVLWFTGIPCSGKTTLADEVYKYLSDRGFKAERLDGDIVRKGLLCNDLGFSREDREKNINRITFVSKVLSRNKVIVLASFVSPYEKTRQKIRETVTNYIEVYVKAPSWTCAERDVKGMWKLAKEGKIKNFTGWSAPYEESINPEIIANTDKCTVSENAHQIVDYLKKRKLI